MWGAHGTHAATALRLHTPGLAPTTRLNALWNDAERIGDHSENLLELADVSINDNRELSTAAVAELNDYYSLIDRQFVCVLDAMKTREVQSVGEALALEEQINEDQEEITQNHIDRLERGICTVQAGVVYLDMIANLEKIGDHLANIAERLDVCDVGGVEAPECKVETQG